MSKRRNAVSKKKKPLETLGCTQRGHSSLSNIWYYNHLLQLHLLQTFSWYPAAIGSMLPLVSFV